MKDETAWLIELPGTPVAWWDGRSPNTFTKDPNDVFRMSRRADAERALSWKLCIPPPGEVRITEHACMVTAKTFEATCRKCANAPCCCPENPAEARITHPFEPIGWLSGDCCHYYEDGDPSDPKSYCGRPRSEHAEAREPFVDLKGIWADEEIRRSVDTRTPGHGATGIVAAYPPFLPTEPEKAPRFKDSREAWAWKLDNGGYGCSTDGLRVMTHTDVLVLEGAEDCFGPGRPVKVRVTVEELPFVGAFGPAQEEK